MPEKQGCFDTRKRDPCSEAFNIGAVSGADVRYAAEAQAKGVPATCWYVSAAALNPCVASSTPRPGRRAGSPVPSGRPARG